MGCQRATFTDPTEQFELTSITRWVPLIAQLVSQILLFAPHTGVRVDDFPTLSMPSQIELDISTLYRNIQYGADPFISCF